MVSGNGSTACPQCECTHSKHISWEDPSVAGRNYGYKCVNDDCPVYYFHEQ